MVGENDRRAFLRRCLGVTELDPSEQDAGQPDAEQEHATVGPQTTDPAPRTAE